MESIQQLIIDLRENKITAQSIDIKKYHIDQEVITWLDNKAKSDPIAQLVLGLMCEEGHGVPINYIKAAVWYEKSATLGNHHAQCIIGYMYDHGYGVAIDHIKAVKWFQMSAIQGNSIAQYNLGIMYRYGYGVDKSISEAVKYYCLSIKNGCIKGKRGLIELINNDNKEEIATILTDYTTRISELEGANQAQQVELEELRIRAPIEGGPLYKEALERFNLHQQQMKKPTEPSSGLE